MPIQHGKNDPFLDLVFALDCTGSMGPYINQAKDKIQEISRQIFDGGELADKEDLRVGIVAFRDYAPQETEWKTPTKMFKFTSDMGEIRNNLATLEANGGGDGPECAITALYVAANDMAWRSDRGAQVVVLITDAAPHGLKSGSYVDGFPDGDPNPAHNPFRPTSIYKILTDQGIHVFVVQCEPSLSTYTNAPAFYSGLAKKTTGRTIPLGNAEQLCPAIVAFAKETLKLRKIITGMGGEAMSDPSHPKLKVATLLRAVAGKQLSGSERDDQLSKLYEDPPDDIDDRIEILTTNKSPEEAITELRGHLKDEVAPSVETSLTRKWSPEGLYNVKLFMDAPASGILAGELKHDAGTCLVGDCSSHTIKVTDKALSDGQIKRLAYMYTGHFMDS